MSKRPNEDAKSEPAAKRLASNGEASMVEREAKLDEQVTLSAAQSAFDRLDFKSAQELCSRIIDMAPENASALALRSISQERRGEMRAAFKDAEAALEVEGEKDLATLARGIFAHLGMASHLLELATSKQNDIKREDGTRRVSSSTQAGETESFSGSKGSQQDPFLLGLNFNMILQDVKAAKTQEIRSPFRRITSELFVRMISFSDSPSLAKSMAVCKSWSSSVTGSPNLFRQFKMEGGMDQIIDGISFFSSRCSNSIEVVDWKINDISSEASPRKRQRLKAAMMPSSPTLKEISIRHSGTLGQLILEIAAEAPLLLVLSSYFGKEHEAKVGSSWDRQYPLPAKWKPKLQKFIWNFGDGLVVDERLLSALQAAKEVVISSKRLGAQWILDLLSSAPTLERLWVPRIGITGRDLFVDVIPSMELPSLTSLYLQSPPKSRPQGDSNLFFKNLHAPNLFYLRLDNVDPATLCHLPADSTPSRLFLFGLERNVSSWDNDLVSKILIIGLQNFNRLKELHLKLQSSTPSRFYDTTLQLLTPLSKESVQLGKHKRLLLPKLRLLSLGIETSVASEDPIANVSPVALASFVAGRKALNRRLSSKNVMLSSMGDLDASSSPKTKSKEDRAFKKKCSLIKSLIINVPFAQEGFSGSEAQEWLRENVESYQQNA